MESELIQWLRGNVPRFGKADITIGDDAAVLTAPTAQLAVTVDTLMDGVHFRSEELSWQQIGHKALAVNVSDIAAMAADPLAAVVSLTIPRDASFRHLQQLYEGMFELSRRFEIEIVGGDTNSWSGPLTISITAFGSRRGERFLTRSGAVAGDAILVTGPLGGSILQRHYSFLPCVDQARHMIDNYDVHAATDITDGLARDLSNILSASRCGAIVELARVPIADDAHKLSESSKCSPLDHALNDGEDFELLITTSEVEAERMLADPQLNLIYIGQCTSSPSMLQRDADGHEQILQPGGYQH